MRFLSLFSGIEAASIAWNQLGWEAVAFAQHDPDHSYKSGPDFPSAVLKHHYPTVPNLGDVTKITEEQIHALGHIDVVVGGFPCQDLSVAGKRAGFQGERSVLFFDAMRVVRWAKSRWVVIENVPGLFSANAGRDFAAVVGALAGCEFDVPKDGWRNSGACVGPNGLVEWTTLDAQFFGLAQRRERVFLVLDTGDWANRPPVLLESESMCGDPPPRRKAGQGVAGSLEAGAGKRRHDEQGTYVADVAKEVRTPTGGIDREDMHTLIPEVVGALTDGAHMGGGHNGQDAYSGRIIPVAGCGGLPSGARLEGSGQRHEAGTSHCGDNRGRL